MARAKQAGPNGNFIKPSHELAKSDADDQDETTDIERWRLLDERGRQTWHYLSTEREVEEWPQSIADRYHLRLPLVSKDVNL